MTKETKKYTDSALNDTFVRFFKTFKTDSGEYKYLDMIQNAKHAPHKVIIDYDDLTDELQTVMDSEPQLRLEMVIYRAIGENFQYTGEWDDCKKHDRLRYEIANHAKYAGQTFGRPAAPTKEILVETINNVMKNLPKEDQKFDRIHGQVISISSIGYMEGNCSRDIGTFFTPDPSI